MARHRVLDLGHNEIESARAIATEFAHCTRLVSLDLRNNFLGSNREWEWVACFPVLAHLNLACNMLGDEGIITIDRSLSACASLARVEFDSNQIGEHGAEALAEWLYSAPSLVDLHHGINNLGDGGAIAVTRIPSLRLFRTSGMAMRRTG